jgi:hypothetical protein
MPRPSHFSRCYHTKNSGWAVQIMKLLIMRFSSLPRTVLTLRCLTTYIYVVSHR